jgi:3-isopropylmalate/(R)-2-methylmalate dehydratase small subunit
MLFFVYFKIKNGKELIMKSFGGHVLFLDRSDINTDEIIPAKYLNEITKEDLKPYLFEDLKMQGFDTDKIKNIQVIVTRKNFGCGSSREHAPWALEVNGITVVIAESFARIFRQNMFNCGMLAIELDAKTINSVFAYGKNESLECQINLEAKKLIFKAKANEPLTVSFTLFPFDEELVRTGGFVEYADARY